jgi:hypothetical protein
VTIKSMQRTIVRIGAKFDKFKIPEDDDDDISEDDDASNRSNQSLTRQSNKRGGLER